MPQKTTILIFLLFLSFVLANGDDVTVGITARIGIMNATYKNYLAPFLSYSLYNVSVEFVNIAIPKLDSVDRLLEEVNKLNQLNLTAIIHSYDADLSQLASVNSIPYYVVSADSSYILGPTMLKTNFDKYDLGALTAYLLTNLQINFASVIRDTSNDFDAFLSRDISKLNLAVETIDESMSDEAIKTKFLTVQVHNEVNNYILFIQNQTLLKRLLYQGFLIGEIRANTFWLIHSTSVDESILNDYLLSDCKIYFYEFENTVLASSTDLVPVYVTDAANHLLSFIHTIGTANFLFADLLLSTYQDGNNAVAFSADDRTRNTIRIAIKSIQKNKIAKLGVDSLLKEKSLRLTFFDFLLIEEKVKATYYTMANQASKVSTYFFKYGIPNLILPSDPSVLAGNIYSLGYYRRAPYYSVKADTNEPYGYSYELGNQMAKIGGFTANFVEINDPQLGSKTESNSWIGLLGSVHYGQTPIAIIPMERVFDDSSLDVSFSYAPVLSSSINLMLKKPDNGVDFFWLLEPIAYSVWIGFVVIFFVFSFVFWATDKISPNREDGLEGYGVGMSCLIVFSSLFMAKLPIKPIMPSARVFALIMWFASFIIVATYASNLVAFLMQPLPVMNFTSLNALANSSEYKWFFVANSSASFKLKTHPVYQKAELNWPSSMFVDNETLVISRLLNNSNEIFIGDQLFIEYALHQSCDLMKISTEELKEDLYIAMNKNLPVLNDFQTVITTLQTKSELDRLNFIWFNTGVCQRPNTAYDRSTAASLKLPIIVGPFCVLAAGLVLSLLVALCEYSSTKLAFCWGQRNVPKLEFGEVYNAEVLKIEPDGIWTSINSRMRKYFLHNCHLHTDPVKIYTAKDLGIEEGSMISVKYFGKDPTGGGKRFMRMDESFA